jgi:ABC-type spermidine/putrescine transport system permease subunit II
MQLILLDVEIRYLAYLSTWSDLSVSRQRQASRSLLFFFAILTMLTPKLYVCLGLIQNFKYGHEKNQHFTIKPVAQGHLIHSILPLEDFGYYPIVIRVSYLFLGEEFHTAESWGFSWIKAIFDGYLWNILAWISTRTLPFRICVTFLK